MVVCFSRSMNGSGSSPSKLAQRAQEFGCRVQADRRLQIGPVEALAEQTAELAIHADIDFGIGQLGHIGQMAAKREGQLTSRRCLRSGGGFRPDPTAC
jgi:hypothetical protein